MSDQSVPMDDAYFRYPTGSAEHYAAYEKGFAAEGGIGYPFPDDPHASYEADNAYELAYDAQEHEDGEWFSPPSPSDLRPYPEQPTAALDDFEAEPWLRVSRDHGTGRRMPHCIGSYLTRDGIARPPGNAEHRFPTTGG